MPIKATKEDGTEFDALLPEEVEAQKAEAIATAQGELKAAKEEVEKYKKVSAEKTESFKKLNEMTEAEKGAMTAKELEDKKRFEASEARANALEEKINIDTKTRIEKDTANALAKYHGGDPKLKEQLEKNFNMINLAGTDTEAIVERARLAKNMLVGQSGGMSPLMAPMNGSGPRAVDKSKREEFLASEKAQKAMDLMGMNEKK